MHAFPETLMNIERATLHASSTTSKREKNNEDIGKVTQTEMHLEIKI